jgi:hypothetical protein
LSTQQVEQLASADRSLLSEAFSVRVSNSGGELLPAMLGSYEFSGGTLLFRPRFPMSAGLHYEASFHSVLLPDIKFPSAELSFRVPSAAVRATTRVAMVEPAAEQLPANLLRFYIEFSEPMTVGVAFDHVQLLDGQGRVVEDAFVETEELWDPSRRRLTLILHPGRIKRGLAMRKSLGAVLRPGEIYTLRVSPQFRDANGQELLGEYTKQFLVTEADRQSPRSAAWTIAAPAAGTRAAIVVSFDEALDSAQLRRMIAVETSEGTHVRGESHSLDDGLRWSFVPDSTWPSGEYSIAVLADLEDVAGNRLDGSFERLDARAEGPSPLWPGRRVLRLSFSASP